MKQRIQQLSDRYEVKPFAQEDVPDIYELCLGNPTYYHYMKMEPSPENIREVITQLPPGRTMEDKYFLGFYDGDGLAALMDLITGFPDEETAFIGWFMVNNRIQGKGAGSGIIEEAVSFLAGEGFHYVRLGYIKGNRQSRNFWEKNGFLPVGTETDAGEYIVIHMQREIPADEIVS